MGGRDGGYHDMITWNLYIYMPFRWRGLGWMTGLSSIAELLLFWRVPFCDYNGVLHYFGEWGLGV